MVLRYKGLLEDLLSSYELRTADELQRERNASYSAQLESPGLDCGTENRNLFLLDILVH